MLSGGDAGNGADVAWVHTVDRENRKVFDNARIRGGNGVAGALVLEDKFKLALIAQKCGIEPRTFARVGINALREFCRELFSTEEGESKLWIVKLANANCGDGIHPISKSLWKKVLETVTEECSGFKEPRFVVQEYISKPALWHGKFKFHLRVYILLKADVSAFIFEDALAHVANKQYVLDPDDLSDMEIHLTNVAKNYHNSQLFHGTPQINLKQFLGEETFGKLLQQFDRIFRGAQAFMIHQRSAADFCFVGADVMLDEEGNPFILELNIPPSIARYTEGIPEETIVFFEKLFNSMINNFVEAELKGTASENDMIAWTKICEARHNFEPSPRKEMQGFNSLAWTVFEKKCLIAAPNQLNQCFRVE